MNSAYCIVIPIHTLQLKMYDKASLVNTCKILHKYDVYIVCPQSLDVTSLSKLAYIKSFDDRWFKSYGAYNRLCLQKMFYEAFSSYEYMLIVQTDAWVFKDELQFWCNKGYDYIGAPWCHQCKDIMKCNYVEKPINGKPIIGNGGFSLRKIIKFIEVTQMIENERLLDKYEFDKTQNEDQVFMEYSKIKWNVPKCSEAINFSQEGILHYHIQHGHMTPFGCHNTFNGYPSSTYFLHFMANIENNINQFPQC